MALAGSIPANKKKGMIKYHHFIISNEYMDLDNDHQ